jgi:hypothetical protein
MFTSSSGTVKEHLLRYSFMDGLSQPMSDDDQDDNHDHDGATRSENEEDGNEDDKEDAAHDDEEEEVEHGGDQHVEDEDWNTPLTSAMQDPHFQELLMNNRSTDARVGDRRKSKLAQPEIDSRTPLYDAPGREPEENHLRVALNLLEIKATHGWSDSSVDEFF